MANCVDHSIEAMAGDHDPSLFECGEQWLNTYIRQHALRNQKIGYGRTYVAVPKGSKRIEGFYTLSMSSVAFQNLPKELAARVPKYPMPVVHMGCLAVDNKLQGLGMGGLLLIDSFRRIVSAADVIAARALDVKAISPRARKWYLDRGFQVFVDSPDHLYLPMETVRMVVEKSM